MEEIHSFNKDQMILEMGKNNPSLVKLKQFLSATQPLRVKEVNQSPALEIIAHYPALKETDLV